MQRSGSLATLVVLLLTGEALAAQEIAGFWSRSLSEGLAQISAEGEVRWILAYFPSPGADRDPRELEELAAATLFEGVVLGATVTADEVENALRRYRVERFPSLLLLTPDGQVAHRWERRWKTQEVLSVFRSASRRYKQYREELASLLKIAERAAEAGKIRTAIRRAQELKGRAAPGSAFDRRAAEILASYQDRVERALLEVLALEGLLSDYRLQRELTKLEDLYPLESLKKRIAVEIRRLKTRKIGGKR